MSITVVGDTRQTLYRFAGAQPSIMENDLETLFSDLQTFPLTVNFRSTKSIVRTCMNLIRYNYAMNGGPYADRFFLDMVAGPDAVEGEQPTFRELDTPEDEAEYVAAEITQRLSDGYQPGDVFIAARTRAQTAYLEGALNSAEIPYVNITGLSFFELATVKDVIAYLKVAVDPNDADSLKRVYRKASADNISTRGANRGEYVPYRFLGNEFLNTIGGSWAGIEKAYQSRNYDRWETGIDDLSHMITLIQNSLSEGPGSAIQTIIERCYRRWLNAEEGLSADATDSSRLGDLETLTAIAYSFASVDSFLAHVDTMVKAAKEAKNKDWSKYVVISTIHRLKGLERKIVFAIGVSEGYMILPNGDKIPAGLLPHTFSLTPPPQMGVYPTGDVSPIEDERCMAFVAFSRAKELLFVSSIRKYSNKVFHPSRFVYESGLLTGALESANEK